MLDISAIALKKAKDRLKDKASSVRWIEGDITNTELESSHYDLWHDRAVFHFLTEREDRCAYVESATRSLKDRGFLILATFAPQGPMKCSGLTVARYNPKELAHQFPGFQLLEERAEEHSTPSRAIQSFTYVLMQKA